MSASSPAPGWYQDPTGPGVRWWDGRAWTDHRGGVPVLPLMQPPIPDGVSTSTRWIVLQALIPLAQVLAQLPYLLAFRSLFTSELALVRRDPATSTSMPSPGAEHAFAGQFAGLFGVLGVTFAVALLLSAAWVVLAVLDMHRLERLGIVQPFHWAWSLLGVVYPIGRAVVLQRRIQRGLGPLWVFIGAAVGSFVLAFALEALILMPMLTELSRIPSQP